MDWDPDRRLHPYPDHPSPQRTPIRDSAIATRPGGHARSGHSAPSSGRRVRSANRTLTRRARPAHCGRSSARPAVDHHDCQLVVSPLLAARWQPLVSVSVYGMTRQNLRIDLFRSDPRHIFQAFQTSSVTAGHWPGQGTTDGTPDPDRRQPVPRPASGRAVGTRFAVDHRFAGRPQASGQVMHTLYVAAHGTVVALGGYATGLQRQLETAKRRRQPIAERPTALEISAAQGMIAVRRVRAPRGGGVLGGSDTQLNEPRASGDTDQSARDCLG